MRNEADFNQETVTLHNERVDSGFGVMPAKGELAGTEIIHPAVRKRVFRFWTKRMPVGLGFLITRYNLKLYLILWIVGIGFIPEEVAWEREQKKADDERAQIPI